MIINDDHKFVFIATTKTGSSAIEFLLSSYDTGQKITSLADSHNKHASLLYIKKEYPCIRNYFKFAFVRNPYDWVVSWYFYRKTRKNKNNTKDISFKKWLMDKNSTAYNETGIGLTMSQLDIVSGDKECKLDFIGKFENLQQDFNIACDKIGIPQQKLPHINKSKHKHYTEYYDDETKSIVAEKYAKDIEYFGYKFGE
jgi:chondroitin 4-sulfotransferase 11